MKNRYLKIYTLIFLGLAVNKMIYADSIVELNKGTIQPSGSLLINLDPLVDDIRYNVTCSLTNPSQSDLSFSASADKYPDFSSKYLNDEPFYVQGILKPGENSLKIETAHGRGQYGKKIVWNINLVNADNEQPIIINRCFAEALSWY